MGLITKPGSILTTSPVEAYVCPASTVTNRVNFVFVNLDSAERQVTVWFVPSGQSTGDQYEVIGMRSPATKLKVGEGRSYPMSQALKAGDKIFWQADANSVVVAHLNVSEVPTSGITVDGFTRVYTCNDGTPDNTGFMPNAVTLAYTIPGESPVGQMIQGELLVHNIDTDPQAFAVRAVPQGEDSGDDEWIIGSFTQQWHLQPGETRLLAMEIFLTANYGIYWRALEANVIVARLSLEEVRF